MIHAPRILLPLALAAATALAATDRARAAILYDNIAGPGGTGFYHVGDNGSAINPFQIVGIQFSPTVSGTVTDYDVVFDRTATSGPSSVVTFRLFADNGGNFPDFSTLLDTFTFTIPNLDVKATINTPTGSAPVLTAGAQYWLIANADPVFFRWYVNSPTPSGGNVYFEPNPNPPLNNGTVTTSDLPSLRVNGTPLSGGGGGGPGVPEPATTTLAAATLLAAAAVAATRNLRRRRDHQ